MQVLNALQIKAGAKVERTRLGNLTQPIQFLCEKDKDEEWHAWNADYLESQGIVQLRKNSRRMLKNYKLAKGIIDKTDYIVEEDNEMGELIDILTKEDESALELKFYPIIPNVINVLCTEFSERTSKLMFRAVDDQSYNEMLEAKRGMLEETLMFDAQMKMQLKMQEMGLEPESEEGAQMMSPENIKSLPEIEDFFKKNYRNLCEEWATHQKNVDTERFSLKEQEERGFRDSLIVDREWWHFRMMEDDYEVELWNPLFTFIFKSPETKYASMGQAVGNIQLMTISDVIDAYGWKMTKSQLDSLEAIYPVKSAQYIVEGHQNDGTFYDATKSHAWNTQMPSLGMRQYQTMFANAGADIMDIIGSDSSDILGFDNEGLIRVSTIYWKSQKKYGHLVKITETGDMVQDIVTEEYKVTDKPIYNTSVYSKKSKDNLIFGEHIDWIWLNETRGVIKIGPNGPSSYGNRNTEGLDPIYLGINSNKPGRLAFQFKGDNSLYGCKLPVEGCIFSDRNTRSAGLVDQMKPFQVGYNMVNNQMADILVDELGTIIVLDQNGLPRHSMGEDWGQNNLGKAYVAMKNFQILPLDTTITNTESALNFQHYQSLDLSQTGRLMSRIELAQYFKAQAFEVIGINPQRMGQQVSQATATGVEQAVSASYAQTEIYFTQHSDYLMPRVHQMRTDLAQYYSSTKPSLRLQYMTSNDEKVNFQINGTKLLMRDFNVFCVTDNNSRNIIEQLKNLALNNNTSGASIYDLGNIVKADSIAELTRVLKEAEEKITQQRQEELTHQQQMSEAANQAAIQQKEMELAAARERDDKMIQKDILVAEIRATSLIGANKNNDLDGNAQSDQIDAMNMIQEQENYRDQMNFKREQEINKNLTQREQLNLKREELAAKKDIANKQLQIAKENKNKYDSKSKKK